MSATDMDDLSINITQAFDELRSIDKAIIDLTDRGVRFSRGVRKRPTDGGARQENSFDERKNSRLIGSNISSDLKRRMAVLADNDYYDDYGPKRLKSDDVRRSVQSSIIMPAIETKSREMAINELKSNEKSETNIRNKRLFSTLLQGTLQRFQMEEKEIRKAEKVQTEKQEEIERRLKEEEMEEKERVAKERMSLMEHRKEKERLIKSLQRRKAIIQYAEQKQDHYRKLQNFIQTQAKPPIFYLPVKHTLRTLELMKTSTRKIDALIEHRRQQMTADLNLPTEKQPVADAELDTEVDHGDTNDCSTVTNEIDTENAEIVQSSLDTVIDKVIVDENSDDNNIVENVGLEAEEDDLENDKQQSSLDSDDEDKTGKNVDGDIDSANDRNDQLLENSGE